MLHAPWTDLGHLQSEIDNVARRLDGKVNNYEMASIRADLDRLACTVGEVRADLATFRTWLERLQEDCLATRTEG